MTQRCVSGTQREGSYLNDKGISNRDATARSAQEVDAVGIGVSIFLLAIGAILSFGINVESDSSGIFNLDTIGVILMVIGAIGMLLSMMFWSSWGGPRREERTVVRDREREVL